MTFQREILTESLIEELNPSLQKHYDETTAYPDILLNPDYKGYLDAEKNGLLRAFIARDENNQLVGYYLSIVRSHAHHKEVLHSFHDMLYVSEEKRGFGKDFVDFCDEQLAKEGVKVSYQVLKPGHGFERKLLELNYEVHEIVYSRRLG